ncbi:MAG: family 43 glycosylhydrolase [Clostridia bacterium]|nr:family 43 glycosylhydrolase [Clostridia bacterium]
MKRQDLRIRDPFIIPWEGKYYMCGSGGDTSLPMYQSDDLENWEELGEIFRIEEDSWAKVDTWAAEIHRYLGKFYLFVSLLGKNGVRGTQVAVCDTVFGKYVPVVNAPITPPYQQAIDATLFVQDGTPYILYSRDWPGNYIPEKDYYVGEIWAAEAKKDLSGLAGEPFKLFSSNEVPLSAAAPNRINEKILRFGSDAPFVQKLKNGSLYLTWSPMLNWNYVVLGAVSESGNVKGPWRHLDEPLFNENGGHAMFFTDFDGNRKMSIHQPESPEKERATFIDVEEHGSLLQLKK